MATTSATARFLSRFGTVPRRRLGDLNISALGFGAYRVSEPEHLEALRSAVSSGVNLIDTSANYCDGASERVIGRLLTERQQTRDELVLVTKVRLSP